MIHRLSTVRVMTQFPSRSRRISLISHQALYHMHVYIYIYVYRVRESWHMSLQSVHIIEFMEVYIPKHTNRHWSRKSNQHPSNIIQPSTPGVRLSAPAASVSSADLAIDWTRIAALCTASQLSPAAGVDPLAQANVQCIYKYIYISIYIYIYIYIYTYFLYIHMCVSISI